LELARSARKIAASTSSSRKHFNLSDVSVSAQMARIKAANPQALLTWTVGRLRHGTTRHRGCRLDIPIFGSNGDMVVEQLSQYKSFTRRMIFSAVLPFAQSSLGNGPVKDAQKVYFDAFKAAGLTPNFPNTLAWDPALIVFDALRHAGATRPAANSRIHHGLHGFAASTVAVAPA